MTKLTKWPMCPAMTQISLGIRPFCSESSMSTWRNLGSLATHGRIYPLSKQQRFWSEYSLGAHVILLVLSCSGSYAFFWNCRVNPVMENNRAWILQSCFKVSAHEWDFMDRVKRIWYLSPMRLAKVHASLRIHAVSPWTSAARIGDKYQIRLTRSIW